MKQRNLPGPVCDQRMGNEENQLRWSNRLLQAIIFDLDGVIVDSHPLHLETWKTFLRSLGRDVPEHEIAFVLEGLKREDILRYFLGNLTEQEVKYYGARKEEIFRNTAPELKTIPGLLEFLKMAEAALLPLGVASSASRTRVMYTLEQLDLKSCFRTIVTGDDVAKGKPDPSVFYMAAQGLGVEAKNILVCEDAVAGVEAAKTAGMKCLAIAANGRGALLKNAGADCVLPDFTSASLEGLSGLFTNPPQA